MSEIKWTTRDYVYVTAECLAGVLSLLGNGLVLVAIKKTPALRTVTNCFIGSLAAADALVGLVIPPTTISPYAGLPKDFHGCILLNSLVVIITNISILNLLAVALDRFLAVQNPFLYQRLMSKKRALLVVAVTWVVAILIGLIPLMGWNLGSEGFHYCAFIHVIDLKYMVYLIFFGVTIPLLLAMFMIYMYLFHIIRKQQQRTKSQMNAFMTREMRQSLRKRRQEVRGAKGLAYVIILFALCWLPIHIMNCITVFAPERSAPFEWLLVAIVLSHANSFVNPFLYAFSNSKFKHAMKRILFCAKPGLSNFDSMVDSTSWVRSRTSTLADSAPRDRKCRETVDADQPSQNTASMELPEPSDLLELSRSHLGTVESAVLLAQARVASVSAKHFSMKEHDCNGKETHAAHPQLDQHETLDKSGIKDSVQTGRGNRGVTEDTFNADADFKTPRTRVTFNVDADLKTPSNTSQDRVWMTPASQRIEIEQHRSPPRQLSKVKFISHADKHNIKDNNSGDNVDFVKPSVSEACSIQKNDDRKEAVMSSKPATEGTHAICTGFKCRRPDNIEGEKLGLENVTEDQFGPKAWSVDLPTKQARSEHFVSIRL